jgi:hypothetical protein
VTDRDAAVAVAAVGPPLGDEQALLGLVLVISSYVTYVR